MHTDERLSEITERLENLTIHEVRQLARALNVHFESSRKPEIIEAVLSFANGLSEPKPKVKGAPPKSDKHDERLAADIISYRESRLAVSFDENGQNGMTVADGGYKEQMKKTVVGLLFITDGGSFLSVESGTVGVAGSFFARYNLKAGDEISGTAIWREEYGWQLLMISEVNGNPPETLADRKDFYSLTRKYPELRIKLAVNNTTACKLIDMFAPLALGQRAVITSPSKGGKTAVLKDIAVAASAFLDTELVLLLLSGKPEEISDFKNTFKNVKIFYTAFDKSDEEHRKTANIAFEYSKRKTESGKNVIIVADGLYAVGADELKKLTCCACNAEEGGSLTVIYSLSQSFYCFNEIIDSANAVVSLSSDLAQSRVYPAIDAKRCYSGIEDKLTADEKKAANSIRAKLTAEQIITLFKSADYVDIIDNYKNG
ncbi:MAG: hypothetical protein K2L42_05420 [Clostridia bacterium]|nr:hypothetical protein [Clostridia bacterium]